MAYFVEKLHFAVKLSLVCFCYYYCDGVDLALEDGCCLGKAVGCCLFGCKFDAGLLNCIGFEILSSYNDVCWLVEMRAHQSESFMETILQHDTCIELNISI